MHILLTKEEFNDLVPKAELQRTKTYAEQKSFYFDCLHEAIYKVLTEEQRQTLFAEYKKACERDPLEAFASKE